MRILKCVGLAAALVSAPALAMVGETSPAPELSKNLVMVLTREGGGAGFCTASVLAANVILTAAHCVTSLPNMRVHFGDTSSPPRLIEIAAVAVHPQFHVNAIASRERSVDLALIKLKTPLPAEFQPLEIGSGEIGLNMPLELAGFGLTIEGNGRSAGKLLQGEVTLRAPLSNLLLWMEGKNVGTKNTGACTGDSGGPVLQNGALVGVITWTTGDAGHHCGKLTQAIRLAPQMGWIRNVMTAW